MPVYAPPIPVLERSIESVQQQVYGDWELCIADDASPDRGILDCLARHAESDHRIHVSRNAVNLGIAGATNAAAALAKGDFLAFLDHDDELTPDALAEMALYVAERPDTDFLYSDDDKIGSDGIHFEPQFKPDWSPELLLSYMYMGHLLMVRRELFERHRRDRARSSMARKTTTSRSAPRSGHGAWGTSRGSFTIGGRFPVRWPTR